LEFVVTEVTDASSKEEDVVQQKEKNSARTPDRISN
jgi:hypothetical protein